MRLRGRIAVCASLWAVLLGCVLWTSLPLVLVGGVGFAAGWSLSWVWHP